MASSTVQSSPSFVHNTLVASSRTLALSLVWGGFMLFILGLWIGIKHEDMPRLCVFLVWLLGAITLMKRVLSSKGATMAIATELKTANKLYSAQDLESLSANGKRYSLILGELIEMPPAGNEHGMFTDLVSSNASVYAQQKKLGVGFAAETGFKLTQNPDTVMAPDWSFIVNERLLKPIEKSYGTVVPDLVIETRSQGDSRSEFLSKILLPSWLRFVKYSLSSLKTSSCVTVHAMQAMGIAKMKR